MTWPAPSCGCCGDAKAWPLLRHVWPTFAGRRRCGVSGRGHGERGRAARPGQNRKARRGSAHDLLQRRSVLVLEHGDHLGRLAALAGASRFCSLCGLFGFGRVLGGGGLLGRPPLRGRALGPERHVWPFCPPSASRAPFPACRFHRGSGYAARCGGRQWWRSSGSSPV